MSEGERKLADAAGDFCYAVRGGEPVAEPTWRSCRVVLTDRRLVLATGDGKQGIPHSKIRLPEDDGVVPDGAPADGATALEVGGAVVLLDTDLDGFEAAYCRAALTGEVILAKAPAVVGGVVQETDWSKARVRPAEDRVTLGFPGGERTGIEVADVGTVERSERDVRGERRPVVAVEHTDGEGRSVETHLSGAERHWRALAALFRAALEDRGGDGEYELSEAESEVLMALYSGVSPFEMADFVGLDVAEVEEIYDRLLDVGAVDKVRERTEVSLNAQGRNMASKEMTER
jgi:hypothetical protein